MTAVNLMTALANQLLIVAQHRTGCVELFRQTFLQVFVAGVGGIILDRRLGQFQRQRMVGAALL